MVEDARESHAGLGGEQYAPEVCRLSSRLQIVQFESPVRLSRCSGRLRSSVHVRTRCTSSGLRTSNPWDSERTRFAYFPSQARCGKSQHGNWSKRNRFRTLGLVRWRPYSNLSVKNCYSLNVTGESRSRLQTHHRQSLIFLERGPK